jgi:hypothetical protein
MKFADPKNDIAFKKIFGDENHKNILISFLNAVLDFKDDKEIIEVEILNPYQVPKIEKIHWKKSFLSKSTCWTIICIRLHLLLTRHILEGLLILPQTSPSMKMPI